MSGIRALGAPDHIDASRSASGPAGGRGRTILFIGVAFTSGTHPVSTVRLVGGLRFDRAVSERLLEALRPDGPLAGLVGRRMAAPDYADVQLRRDQSGRDSWASLYIGLTAALNVRERDGRFRLQAPKPHRAAGRFGDGWDTWQPVEDLGSCWADVDGYLDRLLDGRIAARWYEREGQVHAEMCAGRTTHYGAVQREAAVWSKPSREALDLLSNLVEGVWQAARQVHRDCAWWPARDGAAKPGMGRETDVIGIDDAGRLLVIEAKAANAIGAIPWGVAQVGVYAHLFAAWVDQDPAAAVGALATMCAQRQALGLLDTRWAPAPPASNRVVPVLAIGRGIRSPQALTRIAKVFDAVAEELTGVRLDPLEVWILDAGGDPETIWRPADGPPPDGQGSGAVPRSSNPFVAAARAGAEAWKQSTPLLTDTARAAGLYNHRGPYPFVLPADHAWDNLLPDAREVARTRFAAAGIHWHGNQGHPNPHLLSSQIQCLNALAPLVDRPDALASLLRPVLPVAEALPFGATTPSPFDATDHVVFEWQGLVDHLGEWAGKAPTRGQYATSVDAAVRYRAHDGRIELALIEWKYTEEYRDGGPLDRPADPDRMARRKDRYRAAATSPDGPFRLDVLGFDDYFADPVYQLFRLQLLAAALEETRELDATRVRVVYAAPSANRALLEGSLGTPAFASVARPLGGLLPAWWSTLRRPDRFVHWDTAALLADSAPTSDDFRDRYRHLAQSGVAHGLDHPAPTADQVISRLQNCEMALQRVSGEGSVLSQVIATPDSLRAQPAAALANLAARADELGELAKRFRIALGEAQSGADS